MAFIALIFAYIEARWSKLFGDSAYETGRLFEEGRISAHRSDEVAGRPAEECLYSRRLFPFCLQYS
jgi:hypothetical protein